MRRLLFIVSILLLSATITHAAVDLSVWGGYTSFAMDDVNKYLRDSVGTSGSVTEVNSGFLVDIDLLYPLQSVPNLFLGPRIGYLSCNEGKASNATTSIKENQYVIPLMIGGKYEFGDIMNKISLVSKLFLGLGIGYAKTEIQTTSGGTVTNTSTNYSKTGFTMDLSVGCDYKISNSIDIGLDLGYRLADLGSMSTGSSGSGGGGGGGYGYSPSAEIMNSSLSNPVTGNDVKYDFSGMMINLGINYRFK